jgi:hypothetical protein
MQTAKQAGQTPFALLKPAKGIPVLVKVMAAPDNKQVLSEKSILSVCERKTGCVICCLSVLELVTCELCFVCLISGGWWLSSLVFLVDTPLINPYLFFAYHFVPFNYNIIIQ